jgi:hypothetical protein
MFHRTVVVTLALLAVAACGGNGGGKSSNANLSSLVVEVGGLTPAFSSATTAYTIDVRWSVMSTRVTVTTASNRARVTIDGTAVSSGIASNPINLNVGATPIAIVVTAEDGTQKTYTVTVTRAVAARDADLEDLELTVSDLIQIFDPNLTSYDVDAGYLGASTRVIASASDPLAGGITVAGAVVADGASSSPIGLGIGSTMIEVVVTAEDGVTSKTYTVLVDRALFNTLAQRAYVKATNTEAGDRFGSAVAVSRNWLLTGAPFEQSSATGIDGNQSNNDLSNAGAAYLYERLGGVWTVAHYLKASNTDAGDRFGWAAAAGDRLVIGAPGEQSRAGTQGDNAGSAVGAVYVFEADGTLIQTAYLKASNPGDNDAFGRAVATDADRILVGAEFEQSSATGVDGDQANDDLNNAGAAYLFEATGSGGYAQVAYLKASNTRAESQFGSAVAISGDTLAVGARRESSGATNVNGDQSSTASPGAGAAYVFDRASAGAWSQAAYIKASNSQTDDDFGFALDLDGDMLAVGAPGEDSGNPNDQTDNAVTDSGAVYVFARSSAGSWAQEAYLKAPIPGLRDLFGSSVSLVGGMLAVGAPGERSNVTGINGNDADQSAVDSGAVYVFERSSSGVWSRVAYIKASNTDAGDSFGRNVALGGDTLAVGARAEAGNATTT